MSGSLATRDGRSRALGVSMVDGDRSAFARSNRLLLAMFTLVAALIVQTAEHILRTALDGNISWADCNETLQAAFPNWFGQPGSAENTSHKRLSRARRGCLIKCGW